LDDFIVNQVNNFLGGKSFEDFLIKHIKNILSRFFELESDGTLRIKRNLIVEGNCDTKGIITACGAFVGFKENLRLTSSTLKMSLITINPRHKLQI